MKVILLNKAQADEVRGKHGKYSALDPIKADNGMYILPVEVLNDPEHKEVLLQLGECKFAEIKAEDVINTKLPEGDPEKVKQVLLVKEISPVLVKVEKEMVVKPIYDKVIILKK